MPYPACTLPIDELAELYHEHEWTQRELARRYGVAQHTIRQTMKRAGIPLERRTPRRTEEQRRRASRAGGLARAKRIDPLTRSQIAAMGGRAKWAAQPEDDWTLECRLCGHVLRVRPTQSNQDAWPRLELEWVAHATADHGIGEDQARCLLVAGDEAEWWRPGETPEFRGACVIN